MEPSIADPLFLRALSGVFRSIPPGMRGKGRLARLALPEPLRSKAKVIRNRYGNTMVVPNLLEPVGLFLWMDGVYEPETLDFLRQHVTSDSVFVDVGANIGAFSVPMASSARRVIAIEPSPQVLPFLRKNIALNKLSNVDVVACAVSTSEQDSLPLYLPPESHFGMASSAPQFDADPISVPARSLDAILRDHAVAQVSVMKVDTEGYEASVFLGAKDLLSGPNSPAVIFEFCDWAEERAFPGKKGWAQDILMRSGYTLWTMPEWLEKGKALREPVTDGSHSIVGMPSQKSR